MNYKYIPIDILKIIRNYKDEHDLYKKIDLINFEIRFLFFNGTDNTFAEKLKYDGVLYHLSEKNLFGDENYKKWVKKYLTRAYLYYKYEKGKIKIIF